MRIPASMWYLPYVETTNGVPIKQNYKTRRSDILATAYQILISESQIIVDISQRPNVLRCLQTKT